MSKYRYNNGLAILTTILVVALISTSSIIIYNLLQQEFSLIELMLTHDKLINVSKGALDYALHDMLSQQVKKNFKTFKVIDIPQRKIDNVITKVKIENAHSFFNLNYLYDPNACSNKKNSINDIDNNNLKKINNTQIINQIFENILTKLPLSQPITKNKALELRQNLQKYMCFRSINNTYLDKPYLSYKKPQWQYRRSGMMMISPSEVFLVAGFSKEIYQRLRPYILAWPVSTERQNLPNNAQNKLKNNRNNNTNNTKKHINLSKNKKSINFVLKNMSPILFSAILGEQVDINTAKNLLNNLLSQEKNDEDIKQNLFNYISTYELEPKKASLLQKMFFNQTTPLFLISIDATMGNDNLKSYDFVQLSQPFQIFWHSQGDY